MCIVIIDLTVNCRHSLVKFRFISSLAHFLPAACMFVLGYTGCDPAAPAALYTAALALTGATPAGVYASAADIAPNFAGNIIIRIIKIFVSKISIN